MSPDTRKNKRLESVWRFCHRQTDSSPELNPVENVWAYLRANWLAISVFDSYDAIVDACCTAWNRFANDPNTITSITTRSWAQVN